MLMEDNNNNNSNNSNAVGAYCYEIAKSYFLFAEVLQVTDLDNP